jgi:hypothetical protein
VIVPFTLQEDYWQKFELEDVDVEFLYDYLLELETPLTAKELVGALIRERIRLVRASFEEQRLSGGDTFLPKNTYGVGQNLVFPAFNWQQGKVTAIRQGHNPEVGAFEVIAVKFANQELREFATGIDDHKLNDPPVFDTIDPLMEPEYVGRYFGEDMKLILEDELDGKPGFVRIAGRWFPKSLLIDINIGHLNLTEAVLDMAGGGPLPTTSLIKELDIARELNTNLAAFSLDHALQEDPRFDEVGPAGETLWFLQRLEPPQVLEPPVFLRYTGIDFDRSSLTPEMIELERKLDDELSPITTRYAGLQNVEFPLIFPHLRAGTLPLSAKLRHLFPTAYEAPRIRFILVDGESGRQFPGWVVREKRYVYGLKEWYESQELIPGSIIKVQKGDSPGEVIVSAELRRSRRDWIRTVLVGSDGGIVYAMLKQMITSSVDDRMGIAIPDMTSLDSIWTDGQKEYVPFEKLVINTVRELSRLNPQGHVHATELYAAINIVRRCPPGPILGLLASKPMFVHVGDLHFRIKDLEGN